jgi:hypothetical protein
VNNTLPRLIEGMVATLRKEVIPHIDGDFARGQAYGVIYMLNSIKLRAAWSNAFLSEQLRALEEASLELRTVAAELPGAPLPEARERANLPDTAELEAVRNAGDRRICELIDWLAANQATIAPGALARAEATIDSYLNRQSTFELKTSAKPMFMEISGGVEKSP